jgi:hypothetical protein
LPLAVMNRIRRQIESSSWRSHCQFSLICNLCQTR